MLLGTAAAVLISAFAGFSADCDRLYERTFRLHILANSDSAADQRIKYELRDRILTDMGGLFEGCRSEASARETAERELGYISRQVNDYLGEMGCGQTAGCFVGGSAAVSTAAATSHTAKDTVPFFLLRSLFSDPGMFPASLSISASTPEHIHDPAAGPARCASPVILSHPAGRHPYTGRPPAFRRR